MSVVDAHSEHALSYSSVATPCVLVYSYHAACAREGAAYYDHLLGFKWQLNTTQAPMGYKLTAHAKHRDAAPVFEPSGVLWHDQDRLLCAMVKLAVLQSRLPKKKRRLRHTPSLCPLHFPLALPFSIKTPKTRT